MDHVAQLWSYITLLWNNVVLYNKCCTVMTQYYLVMTNIRYYGQCYVKMNNVSN